MNFKISAVEDRANQGRVMGCNFLPRISMLSLAASVCLLMFNQASFAYEDEYGIEHPGKKGAKSTSAGRDSEYPHAVVSMEAFRIGLDDEESNSTVLLMSAEYALKQGDQTRALKLLKIALERNFDDVEIHKVYAEALEQKYNKQTHKDPDVFNEAVIEWLTVLRQEVGWEKLTKNGLGTPGIGKLYEDEDQVIPARQHLLTLTGVLPKVTENDTKYLKAVLKPSTAGVKGKILKKGEVPDEEDSSADAKKSEKKVSEEKDPDEK